MVNLTLDNYDFKSLTWFYARTILYYNVYIYTIKLKKKTMKHTPRTPQKCGTRRVDDALSCSVYTSFYTDITLYRFLDPHKILLYLSARSLDSKKPRVYCIHIYIYIYIYIEVRYMTLSHLSLFVFFIQFLYARIVFHPATAT